MLTNERHEQILQLLKEKKSYSVGKLAKELYVSDATIRRDLNELNALGLVERTHGGAVLCENYEDVSLFVRMDKNSKEKEIIAGKALKIIPEFTSVFIDSSSTALALAERLDLKHKTVVTNNLHAGIQLSKKSEVNLIVLGGMVQYNTISTTGAFTAKQIEEFYFDLAICSCASVINGETYERSLEQKEIKKRALSRSKKSLLLFDNSKINSSATHKTQRLEDYDYVVVNCLPNEVITSNPKVNFIK